MSSKVSILLIAVAGLGLVSSSVTAQAADNAPSSNALPSPTTTTKEQFEALGPNDMIEVNGQRMTKQQFWTQVEGAEAVVIKRILATRAQAKAQFEAKRKAFLDAQQVKLDDAKKNAQAAAKPLLNQATAGRPANFDATVAQGEALLDNAAATHNEGPEIEQQAAALMKILAPNTPAR